MKLGSSQQHSARFLADKKEKLPVTGVSIPADWAVLLGLFAVVFAGLLFWSWMLFRTVSTESYLKNIAQNNVRTNVNEEQLDRVTLRFEARRERFETLSDGFVFSGVAGSGEGRGGAEKLELDGSVASTTPLTPAETSSAATVATTTEESFDDTE